MKEFILAIGFIVVGMVAMGLWMNGVNNKTIRYEKSTAILPPLDSLRVGEYCKRDTDGLICGQWDQVTIKDLAVHATKEALDNQCDGHNGTCCGSIGFGKVKVLSKEECEHWNDRDQAVTRALDEQQGKIEGCIDMWMEKLKPDFSREEFRPICKHAAMDEGEDK